MGSCAAPSAKGDDKFITTDYLQQCRLSPPTICNSATSTTTCCRPRSSPHSSASRPCPWRSTRTATSTW
ncbi:hypothetical protein EVG17_28635, partial [Klebsiella pneumoniae]